MCTNAHCDGLRKSSLRLVSYAVLTVGQELF